MADQINKTNPELKEFRELIGRNIFEIRKARNMSIEELSEKMGVSKSAVSSIEDGRWAFNIDMLYKFKQVLNFDLIFEI